jgi:hypothetical protein
MRTFVQNVSRSAIPDTEEQSCIASRSSNANATPQKADVHGDDLYAVCWIEPMSPYGITRLRAAQHVRQCVGRLMARLDVRGSRPLRRQLRPSRRVHRSFSRLSGSGGRPTSLFGASYRWVVTPSRPEQLRQALHAAHRDGEKADFLGLHDAICLRSLG